MKSDVIVQEGIIIPAHELDIAASRAGGPGGQHVNKTNSRITVSWNVMQTAALNEEQKKRVMHKLENQLTQEGMLVITSAESRSQAHNKDQALRRLADSIRRALHVPKKRMATRPSRAAKEARIQAKIFRSAVKKTRSKKIRDY